jgi:endonuclease YncB( thermonuclease family)
MVEHREVDLIVDSQRSDKYGRILAHIELGSRYANGEMVERGFAIVYRARRSDRDERLRSSEVRAKAKGLGLWGTHCRGNER